MGRSCHRVFIDPDCWGEESGDEIKLCVVGAAGHDDAPGRKFRQSSKVGFERPNSFLRFHDAEIVEFGLADECCFDSQSVKQCHRRFTRLDWRCRKIKLDELSTS